MGTPCVIEKDYPSWRNATVTTWSSANGWNNTTREQASTRGRKCPNSPTGFSEGNNGGLPETYSFPFLSW